MSDGTRHFGATWQSDFASYPLGDAHAFLRVMVHPQPSDAEDLDLEALVNIVNIVMLLNLGASIDALLRRAVQAFLQSLPDTDRLSIVAFAGTSEPLIPLTLAAELQSHRDRVLWSLDRSTLNPTGRSLMAPPLARALEELSRQARPEAIRRVYCLTGGALDDAAQCAEIIRAHGAATEVHVYGLGEAFEVRELARITAASPWNVVTPIGESRADRADVPAPRAGRRRGPREATPEGGGGVRSGRRVRRCLPV